MTNLSEAPSCEHCHFFWHPDAEGWGRCYLHPPVLTQERNNGDVYWTRPAVHIRDFCKDAVNKTGFEEPPVKKSAERS